MGDSFMQVSRSKVSPVEVCTASTIAKLNSYQLMNKSQREKVLAHTKLVWPSTIDKRKCPSRLFECVGPPVNGIN